MLFRSYILFIDFHTKYVILVIEQTKERRVSLRGYLNLYPREHLFSGILFCDTDAFAGYTFMSANVFGREYILGIVGK